MNFIYEHNAHCTAIIYKSTDGKVIQGRNLDYFAEEFLRETVAHFKVYKGTEYLFDSVGFVWHLGVGTGMRAGEWSIAQNQRKSGTLQDNFSSALKGSTGNLWVVRQALSRQLTYKQSVEYLSQDTLVAPCYYIIAGRTSGSVITRDREQAVDI